MAIPHDNMPPYLNVYIWECVELAPDEIKVTDEPTDGKCVVRWLFNGGELDDK